MQEGAMNLEKHILSQGLADINRREDKHGRTPLMVAAQEGHCRIFDFLISKGANKSDVDNACKNVLHWACKGGHVGMVDYVPPLYGIKGSGMPALIQAAVMGYGDVFEFLVCTGSNVSRVFSHDNYILLYACIGGHLAIVKHIVSLDSVDINTSSARDESTPLMMTAMQGHTDVFDFLVCMGGNVSHMDVKGRNILHHASSSGHLEMVKHILSLNLVDINARDKFGKTAAMLAKHREKLKIYKLLVSRG